MEPQVGTTCCCCYGQNIQLSEISAHADHLEVGGPPEFFPRAAVDSRGCPCIDQRHGSKARSLAFGESRAGRADEQPENWELQLSRRAVATMSAARIAGSLRSSLGTGRALRFCMRW